MRAALYCDIVLMHEGMAAKVGGLGERITDHFITSRLRWSELDTTYMDRDLDQII